jgi:surface polysaccharide O-acyltransferase-like enzyme
MVDQARQKVFTPWVDWLRAAAMFLVVTIHVSGQLTNVWGQIPASQWIVADVYGGIARVSVPLFFMISGYLLLPRTESLRSFYTKRMARILVPFIAWSLIYLAWFCGGHPNTCTPGLVQQLLLVQGTYYHMWFLYVLISVYLILPVLRLIVRPGTDNGLLWYVICLWIIFQPLMTIAAKLWNFQVNISAPLATGFLPYFLLGYLLGEITLTRRMIVASLLIVLLGALVTVVGTYLMTRSDGQFNGFFYDFLGLNVIIASAGAFVLLRWIGNVPRLASPGSQSIARSLASASFGIYLIHILIIESLSFVHVNTFMGHSIWSIPFVSVLVFALSYGIVRLMQKVPVLQYMVPK